MGNDRYYGLFPLKEDMAVQIASGLCVCRPRNLEASRQPPAARRAEGAPLRPSQGGWPWRHPDVRPAALRRNTLPSFRPLSCAELCDGRPTSNTSMCSNGDAHLVTLPGYGKAPRAAGVLGSDCSWPRSTAITHTPLLPPRPGRTLGFRRKRSQGMDSMFYGSVTQCA